jgi:hypothetical protein
MIVRQRRRRRKFSVSLLLFPVFLDIEDSLGNKHKRNNPNNKREEKEKYIKIKPREKGGLAHKNKGNVIISKEW